MLAHQFRVLAITGLVSGAIGAWPLPGLSAEAYDPWPGLVQDVFNNKTMNDGGDVLAIEMPYRAEDASIVPVTLRTALPQGGARTVKAITLVINLVIVVYLLVAKRLFGIRGGHRAEQAIRAADAGWPAIQAATPRPGEPPPS